MTDSTSNSGWGEDWRESQHQFWDAWSRLFKQTLDRPAQPSGFAVPWTAALEVWEKALPVVSSEAATEFFGQMIQQAKAYLHVGEEFARLSRTMTEVQASGGDWKSLFETRMEEMQSIFRAAGSADTMGTLRGMLPAFDLPLDTWIRTLSVANPFPGDFVQTLKPEGLRQASDELHDRIGKFLSVPAVGYTREWQEQTQKTARLALDYQRALQEYVHAHGRLGADAVGRFVKKVLEQAEQGKEITTLREVYDLWVDCGEEAYNAFVLTDEYAQIYSDLVNSMLALKHQSQAIVDEVAGAFNLPTQRGFTTVQRRQQELRREIWALRTSLDEAAIDSVGQQISAIREELAESDLKSMKGQLLEVRHELDDAVLPEVRDALKALTAMGEKLATLERQLRPVVSGRPALNGGDKGSALTREPATRPVPAQRGRGPSVTSIPPPKTATRPRQRKGTR